jgi:hypothetical protein
MGPYDPYIMTVDCCWKDIEEYDRVNEVGPFIEVKAVERDGQCWFNFFLYNNCLVAHHVYHMVVLVQF